MGHLHQTKPFVSGAKMATFLLGATLASLVTFGMFTWPAQAEMLNPVIPPPSTTAGCLLNIGVCTLSTDGTTFIPPTVTISSDNTNQLPVAISASPILAGGTTPLVTITGTVPGKDFVSYALKINGFVVQDENKMTDKSVTINYIWNVAEPNLLDSGTYTITLDAVDKAGKTTSMQALVEVDNIRPDVTVTGGGSIIQSGPISPEVSATDKNAVTYLWTQSDTNPSQLTFVASDINPTFTPIKEGLYSFILAVTDSVGNVTTKSFGFDYEQEKLATIPLPTLQDPSIALLDQTPSTPYVPPSTIRPAAQSAQYEIPPSNDSAVLGNNVTAVDQIPATKTVATIAPTTSGWSIFGLLWYWWLAIAGILYGVCVIMKKIVFARASQHS